MTRSRRTLLKSVAGLGVLGGGYVFFNGVPDGVDDINAPQTGSVVGPPSTDNQIGVVDDFETFSGETIPVEKIEFYESGAAIVYPTSDRGECAEKFGVLHENNSMGTTSNEVTETSVDESDALNTWSFGDFDESVTIDLAGAISKKSNYPSRTFKLRIFPDEGSCLLEVSDTFEVPASFMP